MEKTLRVKLILLLIGIIFLTGCRLMRDITYDGDHPELFSVGIQSLLGARGYEEGHLSLPNIKIISEDNYGRILFSYREDRIDSYLIIQMVDGDHAFFYPYYHFILNYGIMPNPAPNSFSFGFTDAEIDELKEANRWNQPMGDQSEFESVPIIRLKENGPVSDELLIETFFEMFPDVNLRSSQTAISRMRFLRIDRYGRSIYFVAEHGLQRGEPYFAIILQPDHSFDLETGILKITNINNYQTELRLFMEENGWNEPWEE